MHTYKHPPWRTTLSLTSTNTPRQVYTRFMGLTQSFQIVGNSRENLLFFSFLFFDSQLNQWGLGLIEYIIKHKNLVTLCRWTDWVTVHMDLLHMDKPPKMVNTEQKFSPLFPNLAICKSCMHNLCPRLPEMKATVFYIFILFCIYNQMHSVLQYFNSFVVK